MKRQVLIVVHHLTVGGVQKSCMDVLNAIDYAENEVTLYVRKNRLDIIEQVNANVKVVVNEDKTHYYRQSKAIAYICLEKIAKTLKKDQLARKAKDKLIQFINESQMQYEYQQYFSKEKYDVAISYAGGYDTVFVADKISADRKYVFFHGSENEYHNIQKDVLEQFDSLIAVSPTIAALVCNWYPQLAERVQTIENYVDDASVKQKAKEYGVDKKGRGFCFCSCGRYAKVKGYDLAIKAAKILKDKKIDFIWYFVGDGPEWVALQKQIVDNGLQKYIVLTGMQENPYPYIAACDIFIQPSRAESYGLTILEAMILEKPCVSTKTMGGQYLIKAGVTGMLSDIDATSIASEMRKLVLDIRLRNYVCENLKQIDYEEKKLQYRESWKRLLAE